MQIDTREKVLEQEVLIKCMKSLEENTPLRNLKLSGDEEKVIRGFQFISRKSIFVIINVDESQKSSEVIKKAKSACEKKDLDRKSVV